MEANKRSLGILFVLSILTFTAGIHKYFVGTELRADFLFYDYVAINGKVGRAMYMVVFEMNHMITTLVVLILCRYISNSRVTKNIISPFIWISFIDILDYICFYKQLSLIKLPILVILVILYNKSWIWTKK